MTQYKTQYGTVFAVKEHNGAPAIMCKGELSETWALSSMIDPDTTPGAWTAEELQAQLDSKAAIKGWQPLEEPSKTCLCETCTCAGCHEDCFGHCQGCGHPVDHCNSYQTGGEKRLRAEPASAEPPEIVDKGSEQENGFPEWVRPMVEKFLQFPFFQELPEFSAFSLRHSEPVKHHQGGSLADGLYDTSSKGIEFTIFCSDNSDKYRNYTWADFVRRCKVEGLAPEPPHQNKEEAPCNTEPTAPAGDATATTDDRAVPEPSQAAETSTGSPGNSADVSNCPSAEPARQAPAALPLSAPESAPMSLPAFDYSGLDVVTVDTLHLAEKIIFSARQKYIVDLAGAVDMAHEELVRNSDGHNQHSDETFVAWCRSVGISKTTAYQLLQVQVLLSGATPEEQAVLEAASPSLLYAAAKPSAPAELVQAVKDGDITSHKQYQDLLARYNAEKAAREKAEHEAALDRKEQEDANAAALRYKNECDRRAQDQQRLEGLVSTAQRERDDALRQAAEAEKQRDGARDALAAAKLRGDKLKAENDDLKSRPVEAQVVDEEEINRRAQARAAELTAPLREELEALRARHPADLEEAEQAIRDAYDSALYTGRAIENAWHSLRPLLACMDAKRRAMAARQIENILTKTQEELQKCL